MYRVSYYRSGRHKSKDRLSFLVPYTLILTRTVDNRQLKYPARLRDAAVGVEPDGHVVWGECFLSVALGPAPRLQEDALAVYTETQSYWQLHAYSTSKASMPKQT